MHLTVDEIARLSPPERLAMIEQLWSSLDNADIPLTQAQQAELERRLISLQDDKSEGITWENLKAELGARRS